jgi:pilus assembly protein CpaC
MVRGERVREMKHLAAVCFLFLLSAGAFGQRTGDDPPMPPTGATGQESPSVARHDPLPATVRPQVLVHVQVFEVSLTKMRRLGLDWTKLIGEADAKPADDAKTKAASSSQFIDDGRRVEQIVTTLRQEDLAKVLLDPKLVTASGRTIVCNAGKKVPMLKTDDEGLTTVEQQYSTRMEVTPEVLNDEKIRVAVQFRLAEPKAGEVVRVGNVRVPTAQVTEVAARVELPNGHTLALHGLQRVGKETRVEGVPLVSSIPYVGTLFQEEKAERNEVTTLILIRPVIVRPDDSPATTASRPAVGVETGTR